ATAAAEEALALQRKLLKPDHPLIADAAAMLAYWSIQSGKYEKAEPLLTECLAIREKTAGKDHPDYASALTLLAGVQLELGRSSESRETARTAREILQANFAADHWRVAAAANVEGGALTEQGKYEEAERLLLDTDGILANAPMPGVAERSRQRLARLYTAWGKNELAAQYRAQE
ncbi:MAG: tetratricopeptide repeat protein, partial [Halioglobus sp.]|nr:tetratricopeptide repeat protein [Halioglobus sp.]